MQFETLSATAPTRKTISILSLNHLPIGEQSLTSGLSAYPRVLIIILTIHLRVSDAYGTILPYLCYIAGINILRDIHTNRLLATSCHTSLLSGQTFSVCHDK